MLPALVRPATLLLVSAAAAGSLVGCGTVRDTFGIKSTPTPTSNRSTYLNDLGGVCTSAKTQFDIDATRFAAAVGDNAQADGIARIVQDYRDLQREVTRVPAPTTGTSGLALTVLNRRLPSISGLESKASDLRKNLTVLSATDVSDIQKGLTADFCTGYVGAVADQLR